MAALGAGKVAPVQTSSTVANTAVGVVEVAQWWRLSWVVVGVVEVARWWRLSWVVAGVEVRVEEAGGLRRLCYGYCGDAN